jgi:hypothetical protein
MGNMVKYERRLGIGGKIFNAENIEKLAYILEGESNHSKSISPNNIVSLKFILNEDFGSKSWEFNSVKEFTIDTSLLNERKISEISMKFHELQNFHFIKSISLQLNHSEDLWDNSSELSISGDDQNWVNGLYQKFEDELKYIDKRKWTETFIQVSIPFLLSFAIVFAIIEGASRLSIAESGTGQYDALTLIVISGLAIIFIGFILTFILSQWFKQIYPYLELDIGPQHLRFSRNKRRLLTWLMTAIVIPLMTGLFFHLL